MSLFKALFAENILTLVCQHKGILTQRSKTNKMPKQTLFSFQYVNNREVVLSKKISAGSHKA